MEPQVEQQFDSQFDSQKIVYHPDWVKGWSKDPFWTIPVYIEISPIGLCNHRCTFCAKEVMGYPNRSLPLELLLKFTEELAGLKSFDISGEGVKSFMFAGEGEPTLFKELDKVIAHAHKHGIDTGLTTNATGLTEKFVESTLPYLSWVKASINAGRKETYSLIHQTSPEHWDLVWRNMERAIKVRDKFGYRCEIGCQTVLLVQDTIDISGRLVPANWQEALELAHRAKAAGLDHLVIKPYGQNPYSKGSMERYGDMVYTSFLKAFEEMDREVSKLNDDKFKAVFRWRTLLSYESETRGYPICLATPTAWAYLQSDGMIISCAAHNSNPNFDLGNIKDKTFKEIWWSERRRQHMKFMESYDISNCRKNCRMHFVNQALDKLKNLKGPALDNELATLNVGPVPPNVNFL